MKQQDLVLHGFVPILFLPSFSKAVSCVPEAKHFASATQFAA